MRARVRIAAGLVARGLLAIGWLAAGAPISLAVPAAAATGAAAADETAAPTDPYPKAAEAYLVAVNGVVLWQRAPDRALPPASLTKLMTALVLLDDWQPDAIVTVSPRAAAATGSRLGLRAGERLRFADAFDALLVSSANDACLALAEHAAGTVEAFVARMNARAGTLALAATRFANPCGLDAPGHLSTARDLQRLATRAMQAREIARAVARPSVEVRTLGGRVLRRPSGNQLLGRVPGAVGIKTGYTNGAGKCLAALVRRGHDEVLLVLLDAPDRWWAASILIDDAFAALDAARR
jgi:D-alanyl-D-alanine carboxypeptidase (penicillin-binding protein 5/6)